MVTPFSVHCISDQKVRTDMVRARVRVMVRVGDAVVRIAVGRKVRNPIRYFKAYCTRASIICYFELILKFEYVIAKNDIVYIDQLDR